MTDLAEIQKLIRAPKSKENTFGKYKYRNAEMILAAFKELNITGASLTCSDTLQEVAGQIFVTATARLVLDGVAHEAQGHAMHPLEKKGMDPSQITGSASSYARKYALCGLFAIEDESQDPDSHDNRGENGQRKLQTEQPTPEQTRDRIKAKIEDAQSMDGLTAFWGNQRVIDAVAALPADMRADLQAAQVKRAAELFQAPAQAAE